MTPISKSIAVSALFVFGTASNAQTFVSEPFRSDQAAAWSLLGSARLTASPTPSTAVGADNDSAGNGWLEITPNAGSQIGAAVFNSPVSSAAGLDVEFDYAMYLSTNNGGSLTPAFGQGDGFTVFLMNGSQAANLGLGGSQLGYNTMLGAYVGLGFDRYGGGLGNSGFGTSSNHLGMRGSSSSNPWLGEMPYSGNLSANRSAPKHVRVTITPAPDIRLTVSIDGVEIWSKDIVIGGTPINGINAVPASFKLGLSASTGGASQNQQFRDMVITGLTPITAADDEFVVNGVINDSVRLNDPHAFSDAEYTLVSAPAPSQGNVSLNPDGSFSFTPAAGFSGTGFEYQVCAGPGGALPCTQAQVVLKLAAATAPTITSATASDKTITLAIDPPAPLIAGVSVLNYDVQCTSSAGNIQAQAVTPPVALNGLANGVSYSCQAVAHLSNGETTPPSSAVEVTPRAPTPQAVPVLNQWLVALLSAALAAVGWFGARRSHRKHPSA